jgi:hypothetical protein
MRLALALATTLALAAPAQADPLTWTDPCGDANTVARLAGTRVVEVTTARTARHDLREATVRSVPGGVDVVLRTCGPIPAPEAVASTWQVTGFLDDGCSITASLSDAPGNGGRSAALTRACTRPGPLPGSSETVVDRSGPVDAEVAGDTITWRLRDVPEAEPGTRWADVGARSRDAARGTEAALGDLVAANGPGASDEAPAPGPFTAGAR